MDGNRYSTKFKKDHYRVQHIPDVWLQRCVRNIQQLMYSLLKNYKNVTQVTLKEANVN